MISGTETHDVDIYRPTLSRAAGDSSVRSYSAGAHETNVPATLRNPSAGRSREEFGIKKEIKFICTLDEGADVETDDVLQIVAGKFVVGDNLLVMDKVNEPQTESIILGLTETNDGP